MKCVSASATGEPGPSSSFSGPRASSESAIVTPTVTDNRMSTSASHDRQDCEGSTSTGRKTIGCGNPSTVTAHTTESQTGDIQASIQSDEHGTIPHVSGSSPWSRKRRRKEGSQNAQEWWWWWCPGE